VPEIPLSWAIAALVLFSIPLFVAVWRRGRGAAATHPGVIFLVLEPARATQVLLCGREADLYDMPRAGDVVRPAD
jgi:hypothetical protein